jgi:hypothetical protein
LQSHEDGLQSGAEEKRSQRVTLANAGGADAQDGTVRGIDRGRPTVAPAEETLKAGCAVVEAVEYRSPAHGVEGVGKIHLLDSEAGIASCRLLLVDLAEKAAHVSNNFRAAGNTDPPLQRSKDGADAGSHGAG